MNKKKRIWVISAVAVLLLVLGIVGKKQGWWGQTDEELVVEVGKVESQTIIETVSASGRIQPAVEVKISPEVSGEIIELRVVEGQYSCPHQPRSLSVFGGACRGLGQSIQVGIASV